jgi:hypothetical protein
VAAALRRIALMPAARSGAQLQWTSAEKTLTRLDCMKQTIETRQKEQLG